ncbi:MAG TPA: FkbM family methyltransferase [Terracidiphilus sp.]
MDRLLDKCGYKLERTGQPGSSFFSQLLNERMKISKEIVFVQIGANDGISNDPLYSLIKRFPRRFRGLVVEPLKDKFELLERTYADVESVVPVNLAVHNTEKEMLIWRVRPDLEKKLPGWAGGMGSFNPEYHKLSQLDSSLFIAEKVFCTTFDDLLTGHRIAGAELLVTDTEGYDFEILRNIDFAKHRPTYIHFEHGLSGGVMSWERYKNLIRYLTQHGYTITQEASDATAFLPAALDPQLGAPS